MTLHVSRIHMSRHLNIYTYVNTLLVDLVIYLMKVEGVRGKANHRDQIFFCLVVNFH